MELVIAGLCLLIFPFRPKAAGRVNATAMSCMSWAWRTHGDRVQSMFVHNYEQADLDSARKLFTELISSALHEIDLTKSLKMERAIQGLDHVLLEFLSQHAHMEYF